MKSLMPGESLPNSHTYNTRQPLSTIPGGHFKQQNHQRKAQNYQKKNKTAQKKNPKRTTAYSLRTETRR